MSKLSIACVLLAAGTGKRFGGNKLMADFNGKPILEHVLMAVPKEEFCCCIIVAGNESRLELAKKYGIDGVINEKPEEEIALSIRLGIEQLGKVDAVMFLVCDQPMLKTDTIIGMLKSYHNDSILALSTRGKRGNPVIFPACLLKELSGLKAGETGVDVINEHSEMLKLYDIDEGIELVDIDTECDLAALNKDIL